MRELKSERTFEVNKIIMDVKNKITQDELNLIWDEVDKRHKSLRKGQAFFNSLPLPTAEEVRGTEIDPFYNDRKLNDCVNSILK